MRWVWGGFFASFLALAAILLASGGMSGIDLLVLALFLVGGSLVLRHPKRAG